MIEAICGVALVIMGLLWMARYAFVPGMAESRVNPWSVSYLRAAWGLIPVAVGIALIFY